MSFNQPRLQNLHTKYSTLCQYLPLREGKAAGNGISTTPPTFRHFAIVLPEPGRGAVRLRVGVSFRCILRTSMKPDETG